jgi:hypothetical protein
MISFKEFSEIFSGTDFTDEELRGFYYSVKKSVILKNVGKRAWPELFNLEERCQWPVVRRIDDPKLPIYRGADKVLLQRFIKTISEEKTIRRQRPYVDRVRYWTLLQSQINERIELFTHIFGFGKKDMRHCEEAAERYSRRVEKRIKNRKRLWQIGIGTGAATLAGAAAFWYLSKRDKK